MLDAMVNMAIESWRFSKVFEHALVKNDLNQQTRYKSQLRWFVKKIEDSLEQAGLRIVNIEGANFDSGMPVTPLNLNDFEESDQLIVEQMIEPIIMSEESLIRTGVVILKKVNI